MTDCPVFRPDHNGECLNCDEWMDAHTPQAIAAGTQATLSVWVIYDHPKDQPDFYLVRRQWANQDGTIQKDRRGYGFGDVQRARLWLAQKGLTRLERHPDDDPVIMETWL